MFFVWSQKRVNVKWAWWGPVDSGKTTSLHALAEQMHAAGAEAGEDPGVGLLRNADPVEIDEPHLRMTTYFCHPPADSGRFAGWPVHYQIKTVEQPLAGNHALEKVLDGVSVVLFCADASRTRQAQNEAALRDLVARLAARAGLARGAHHRRLAQLFVDDGPYRMVLQVNRTDADDAVPAEAVARGLMLPTSIPVRSTAAASRRGLGPVFDAAAAQTRPLLKRAQSRGRLPTR